MARRLTPFKLLLTTVLIIDLAAVSAHEVSIHSAPCQWAVWRIPHCEVAR